MHNPMLQQLAQTNPQMNTLKQFNQFKQQMAGKDPQAIITDLLNTGKMTPQQFENLKAQAMEMQKFLR